MKIKVKDKIFDIKQIYDSENNYYNFVALNSNNEEMGFVNFGFTKIYGERSVWIYKIETYENFQHQGVGQALLWAMEYFACSKRVLKVIGKFYPENKFAKPFYEKNKYLISKEEDWEVEKYIDYEFIKQQIEPIVIKDIKETGMEMQL